MIISNADGAWKEVLENFFNETIAFSFPLLYQQINWNAPITYLDKELQIISPDSESGARFVDKLVKVYTKDGNEKWLLVHVEIQGNKDLYFPRRMFVYHYRIFDKFNIHPVSCAILIDDTHSWRPEKYESALAGCRLIFEYPILKLIHLEKEHDKLERSENPFASIILAQLEAIKNKKSPHEKRKQIKLSATKRLYEKGYSKNTIRQIFHFIDALIRLPEDLELQFKNDIFKFEGMKHMAYISTIEQMGIDKGIQKGIQIGRQEGKQEGKQELLLHMLHKGAPIEMIAEFTDMSKDQLTNLIMSVDEKENQTQEAI